MDITKERGREICGTPEKRILTCIILAEIAEQRAQEYWHTENFKDSRKNWHHAAVFLSMARRYTADQEKAKQITTAIDKILRQEYLALVMIKIQRH